MQAKAIREKAMRAVFLVCACVSILCVAMILFFLLYNGIPSIREVGFFQFLGGRVWRPSADSYGILPMIAGSICVTAGAMIVGVPLGLFAAVFLARFCPKGIYRVLRPAVELLAGIPSVVYGFFGLKFLVPLIQNLTDGTGKGILTASILLGFMILPTIIMVTESALRAVPETYNEGALALGATPERSVFSVILPAAKSGTLAAVILGVGRAIGETMAVVMVAGNQTLFPTGVLSGVRTLTSSIVLEMGYAGGLHRGVLIGIGIVLFVLILFINLCFSLVKRKER